MVQINRKSMSAKERLYVSTQWQLIWRKFRKHKLAQIGAIMLLILYLIAMLCEFVAPLDYTDRYNGKFIPCAFM
ncbi:MAG TPA: hypothetical protein PKE04_07370 [Clostridia bacterium]|nr:hypothetical protein [Clostridia bacterium]